MTPEIFAEWLRRQGHRVFRTPSSYWFDQGPRVYQGFPYHWIIRPERAELDRFLRGARALGLRYSTDVDFPDGCISYHAVYQGKEYHLEQLGRWARKNVRRGLKNCVVEPISFARLKDEGWDLQIDTLDRQGRKLELERRVWERRCQAAGELAGFEAWGALVEGKLAASVITFLMDDTIYMLYQQCRREYLAAHVNNALGFEVTRRVIGRPQVRGILYGLHSLDAPPSVDEFKFRMGYEAKPVRQRVVFHPWLARMFNPLTHRMLCLARRWKPGNPTLAKAEGMLRFHLEGRLPLERQSWPEVLRGAGEPDED